MFVEADRQIEAEHTIGCHRRDVSVIFTGQGEKMKGRQGMRGGRGDKSGKVKRRGEAQQR